MLMPKRVKRRKQFRGTMSGKAMRGNKITNGEYGIVALEPCWIKSNQIEAARVAMTRYIKRGGKVWIKIFPDKPVTAKPAETRTLLPGCPALLLFLSERFCCIRSRTSDRKSTRLNSSHRT